MCFLKVFRVLQCRTSGGKLSTQLSTYHHYYRYNHHYHVLKILDEPLKHWNNTIIFTKKQNTISSTAVCRETARRSVSLWKFSSANSVWRLMTIVFVIVTTVVRSTTVTIKVTCSKRSRAGAECHLQHATVALGWQNLWNYEKAKKTAKYRLLGKVTGETRTPPL